MKTMVIGKRSPKFHRGEPGESIAVAPSSHILQETPRRESLQHLALILCLEIQKSVSCDYAYVRHNSCISADQKAAKYIQVL
jgi:hypothetical protein